MKKPALKHGFVLKDSQEIGELKLSAHVYEHQKSGAELIHLACEDSNKVFCVAFKTIPEDSSGCPHIIEHSVLNGSRNYPAKNSFMELIKGSLHTFVNAMTSSDMTIYPVASTNDKDFMNLSRVYMDAVFFPRIYEQPEIMHQEGWHYELNDPEGELKIRGVVYNEMKGAYSSPDALIRYGSHQAQFPDTPYGLSSGGDPEVIPQLSYEKFLDFHRKYYHPSNSRTLVYGNLDIDALLEMMDTDYLSHFDRDPEAVVMPAQKPFSKPVEKLVEYPIDEHKAPDGMYHLSLNYTWGSQTEMLDTAAFSVLSELLMMSTASPLKRKIMESGLAGDSYAAPNTDILQPSLSIICKHVKEENLQPLVKLINTELKRIAKEGFDKKLIEAVLNSREFFYREGQMHNFPKGLYFAWTMLGPWMHGADPLHPLRFEALLKDLRKGLTEPYYEAILEKALIKNKHHSIVTFKPVPGLLQTKESALKAELAKRKAQMKAPEIEALVKFNRELQTWQMEDDSPEDIARIPALSLDDIDRKAAEYPMEVEVWKEFTLLKHEVNTNGIVYLKAYFDLAHADEEDLPWLALFSYLAGKLDSENYSYADLANEIDIHTGGIDLRFSLLNSYQDPDVILPKYIVAGKAVTAKSAKLMELAAEYALKPDFADHDRLRTLIRELKTRVESQLMMQGVMVAINRMFAPFSQIHKWRDHSGGLQFFHWLVELETRLNEDIEAIIGELEWVRKTFFSQNNLIISLTAGSDEIAEAFKHLVPVVANISSEVYAPVEHHFNTLNVNEGIMAPVQVQFCAKGGNFFRKGYSYSGKLRVLNNVLSNEFLYKELRVKGGAYGAMSNFSLAGYLYFCSYRDPNLRETLEAYNLVPDYLRSFDCSKRDMDKYIIGDISSLDYPKIPEAIGAQADEDYITGFTQADRQQIRDEVLSTSVADIRSYADMIEAIMSKDHYCVFGNEEKVREAAELFNQLTPVYPG